MTTNIRVLSTLVREHVDAVANSYQQEGTPDGIKCSAVTLAEAKRIIEHIMRESVIFEPADFPELVDRYPQMLRRSPSGTTLEEAIRASVHHSILNDLMNEIKAALADQHEGLTIDQVCEYVRAAADLVGSEYGDHSFQARIKNTIRYINENQTPDEIVGLYTNTEHLVEWLERFAIKKKAAGLLDSEHMALQLRRNIIECRDCIALLYDTNNLNKLLERSSKPRI
jgi:hypothetical protein